MKYGIEHIDAKLFAGKRVGLVTTSAARNAALRSSIDLLRDAAPLTALFAPEHGIRGEVAAGETVRTYTDAQTGLPVHSLYKEGGGILLTPDMVREVDVIAYDIPDIGARYYTYLSTLLQILQVCAKLGKEVVVFDRPNPLGGAVEGPLLKPAFKSFVGAFPMCVRYGLTIGEYAQMVCAENKIDVMLRVIRCTGWTRQTLFSETGRLWIPPSPSIPSFETALLYPGTCLFEGTNLSEGRGTALPFAQIGAPFVNAAKLCEEMQNLGLAGVQFLPVWFTPTAGKHQGEVCGGVQLYVTNPNLFSSFSVGTHLLFAVRRLYETKFSFFQNSKGQNFIDLLCGSDLFTKQNASAEEVLETAGADQVEFAQWKRRFHLYE